MSRSKPIRIGAVAAIALLIGIPARPQHAASAPAPHWWDDQVNVVTWADITDPGDESQIAWLRATNSDIADRGVSYGSNPGQHVDHLSPSKAAKFHALGLKVTCKRRTEL